MTTLFRTASALLLGLSISAGAVAANLKTPDADAAQTKAATDYKQSKDNIQGQVDAAKADCSQLQGEQASACKQRVDANKEAADANAKAKLKKDSDDAKALKKQGYP